VNEQPDRSADAPVPPPPPPDLIAPAATAAAGGPLRRISGLATAIRFLVPATALLGVLFAVLTAASADEARAFLDGTLSEEAFIESYGPGLTLQLGQTLTQLAAGITTILWMHRLAANTVALGRAGTWRPGWAIGGWFVPPFILYVIPFLMLRELWRANDDTPTAEWRRGPVSPLVTVWFGLFGVAPLAFVAIQGVNGLNGLGTGAEAIARQVVDDGAVLWGSSLLALAAAVVFSRLVTELTNRHRRLAARVGGDV
jgi:hypothetical protein